MYDLFVGNKSTYIEWVDGRWLRRYSYITPHLIKKHMEHEVSVGSYTIYNIDDVDYCKWICIDIDSHKRPPKEKIKEIKDKYDKKAKIKAELKKIRKKYKKFIDHEMKKRQKEFSLILYERLAIFGDSFILEDSGGGFHLWIFLKDRTLLEDAGKFIEMLKPGIMTLYYKITGDKDCPEFYPKQYTTDHLDKGCGNGVRLPYGINQGKSFETEIIKGDIYNVKLLDITPYTKYYHGIDVTKINTLKARTDFEEYNKQSISDDLYFWYAYPRIRPCFKRIMDGRTQCYDEHGHNIRIAMVHELNYFGVPFHLIIEAFSNQFDFEYEETRSQVESVIKNDDWRWGCAKIKQLGYCHENCKRYRRYRITI